MDTQVRGGFGLDGMLDVMPGTVAPSRHAGVIAVRGFRFRPSRPQRLLVLPSPVVRVAISVDGGRLRVADATTACPDWLSSVAVRVRVNTRAVVLAMDHEMACMEIVLAPWAAFHALGGPPMELTKPAESAESAERAGSVAPPVGVSGADPAELPDLVGRLAEARSWEQRLLIAGLAFSRGCAAGPPPARVVLDAFAVLRRAAGRISIRSLAQCCGCSERLLEKRFREQVGVSPKAVARVLRLRHAVALLSQGRSACVVACACGYSDQAHLVREFTAMTGLSPARFLRELGGPCTGGPRPGGASVRQGSDSFNTGAAKYGRLGLAMVVDPKTAATGESPG